MHSLPLNRSRFQSDKFTECAADSRHLRAFHMAVPALVAAAVEAGLVAKEALARRRRGPAAAGFTNDGFPLGLVFLLKARALTIKVTLLPNGITQWELVFGANSFPFDSDLVEAGLLCDRLSWVVIVGMHSIGTP